jgi:hypothetical protein
VDDDGYDDLLFHSCVGTNQSEMALLYGGADRFDGDILLSEADALFTWISDWMAGTRKIGDVNQDGIDDILVGVLDEAVGIVYGRKTRIGGINIESGVDLWLSDPEGYNTDSSHYAHGDIDGDAINDLLVGIPYHRDCGALFVLRGSETALISGNILDTSLFFEYGVDIPFLDSENDENFGYGVSSGGDINGDGYHDILIGVSGESSDAVYLLFGTSMND